MRRNSNAKRQVIVYLVPDLHRALKALAAVRDSTISHLVELAARKQYGFDGLLAAETPQPYGRSADSDASKPVKPKRTKRTKRSAKSIGGPS